MEPPKKRKYPLDEAVAGECDNSIIDTYVVDHQDQMDVVSGSIGVQAKRNRRSYSLEFKVSVLDGYYHDPQTRLNQRKTAIKYGVNRRQIQKWLAQEDTLRGSVGLDPRNVDKTTLSTYLNYQTKINYLRRMEGGPAGPKEKVTMVEVTPEFEQEEDFVIDERGNYEALPINLSKGDSTIQARDDRIVPIIKLEPNQTPHTISSFTTDISSLTPAISSLPHTMLHASIPPARYGETTIHQTTSLHHQTSLNQDTTINRSAQDTKHHMSSQDTKHHMSSQDTKHHMSSQDSKHHMSSQDNKHHISSQNTKHHISSQDSKHHISSQDSKHHMSSQDTNLHQTSATRRDSKMVEGEPSSHPKLDVNSHADSLAEDRLRNHLLDVSSRTPGPVSAHVLDTSTGRPAVGVRLALYREVLEDAWDKLDQRFTDKDGRATDMINWEDYSPGIYKIKFYTGDYFKSNNRESCYPYIEVTFEIKDPSQRHHVSLNVTPYGYYTCGA